MNVVNMRYFQSILHKITGFIVLILLTACGGGGGSTENNIDNGNSDNGITQPPPGSGANLTSITIYPENLVLKVGASRQMTAIGNYSDGGQLDLSGSVNWYVAGFGAITLSGYGLVAAAGPGSSILTAIKIDTMQTGTTFIHVSTYGLEGSVAKPVMLSPETVYNGEVNFGGPGDGNGYSYYAVNVTPGAAYYVFLSEPSDDTRLELYDDSGFTHKVCETSSPEPDTSDKICYADGPPGGTLYIAVNGDDTQINDDMGAAFTLTVKAGYRDQGSVNSPAAVNINTPLSAQVGRPVLDSSGYLMNGRSLFSAAVALTGRYTISVTDPTDQVSLSVLDGAGSGVVICGSNNAGAAGESCSFQANKTPVYIHIDSTKTATGAAFTLNITEDHAAYSNEGTLAEPAQLTTLPHQGQVGGINGYNSSYYSINVTALQSLQISATNLDGGLSMYVYDGDASFTAFSCNTYGYPTSSPICLLEPAMTGTVYIKMSDNGIGTEFTLNVTPINYSAQGSSVSPQVLDTAPTWNATYTGTVDTGASYYRVPVNAGKLYRAGLANVSGDISLTVYDNAALTTVLCASNAAGLTDESCQATPSGGNIWIVVGGNTYGSKYDLTVDRVYSQQGNLTSPLDITGSLPTYSGGETGSGTGATERSHLKVTLTAGKAYTFQISNNTDATLSVWVFDNSTYSWPTVCAAEAYNSFTCTVNPLNSGTAYIWATSDDPYGSAFDLTITESAFNAQGSVSAPVNIGSFPVSDAVGIQRLEYKNAEVNAASSYFVTDISGGYAYVNFAVGLLNQSADVDLYVYDDTNFTNLLCSSVAAGTADEHCTGLNPAGNNLYIKVSGASSGFGGRFTLSVDHDYSAEGAVSTGNGGNLTIKSVALTQGVGYQGQAMGSTASYYYLPAFTPGTHTITVSNMFDSACVWIYDEADGKFNSNAVWSESDKAVTPDKSYTGNFTHGVFVQVAGCGSTNTGTAFTVTID